jgi:hypothetical protein
MGDWEDLRTDPVRYCFAYPLTTQARKHGPIGYANAESFRDWLRDEFDFRCPYCLMRETWLRGCRGFEVDHCVPQSADPSRRLVYDNLVYTCPWCNRVKSNVALPNPTDFAYGTAMSVNNEGMIVPRNNTGRMLIEGLKLDHPEITYQRRLILRILRLAAEKEQRSIVRWLLGFPNDLPNLGAKHPPGGNSRPQGILHCRFEQRRRNEIAELYC